MTFFFVSECQCMSDNYICEAYGGQCECDGVPQSLSSRIGRQCELCPFYSYSSIDGCTGTFCDFMFHLLPCSIIACTCPDQFDDCSLETGECSGCPPLTFGNSCENCVLNTYRDEDGNCMVFTIIYYEIAGF